MRRIVLTTSVLLAGCNPVPYKHACQMPDFGTAANVEVEKQFNTWGYFSERCPKAMPKRFSVAGKSASLNVVVEGEWLRLSARDQQSTPLRVRGNTLRGNNARVDEQQNATLDVEVVGSDGTPVERFTLPFASVECTCVTYDAI